MNINSPYLVLCISILFLRTLIAISRSNWIFLWISIEINILRFIPIIMYSKNFQETEAAVKYFLTQALGSSLLLIRRISLWSNFNIPNQNIIFILLMSLILKTGIVPCHIWYPSVIISISWLTALILSTWQKLAPLSILTFIFSQFNFRIILSLLAGINALIGGLIGINQSHLRVIIAYSSISHLGWIIRLISINMPISTIFYFIIYSFIIIPLFIILFIKNSTNSNSVRLVITNSPSLQFLIPFLLLSISGLPPLTGFIPKWIAISSLASLNPILLIVLIAGAMINTYFYLIIIFNFILVIKPNKVITNSSYTPLKYISILTTCRLFIIPLLII